MRRTCVLILICLAAPPCVAAFGCLNPPSAVDDDDGDPADDDTTAAGDDDSGDDDTSSAQPLAEGRTYLYDLGSATFTEPPMAGEVVGDVLGNLPLLVSPRDFTADRVDLLFGLAVRDGGDEVVQDTAVPTIGVPGAWWDDPAFGFEAGFEYTLHVGLVSLTLSDTTLTGAFVEDASAVVDGTLETTFDSRALDQILGNEEGVACALLAALGSPCLECASDLQPFCVRLAAEDVTADEVPGLTLVAVGS